MDDQTRFAFGANWQRLEISQARIERAVRSLEKIIPEGMHQKRFLDVGCGSGLFSLAAVRLGADVHSFDFDRDCVECARTLKAAYAPDASWRIEHGSVLDRSYTLGLGEFDIVYSWGVLHHTGDLWIACRNAAELVRPDGRLIIAIYNDQGWRSKYWKFVKKQYCAHPWMRPMIVVVHLPMLLARLAWRALQRTPLERGMSLWRDYLDWLGGYPFEVAMPNEVVRFHDGFELVQFQRATSGCNEFSFRRRRTG
jgi:2-polyprenyl-6-hydroxyphenyl methylase/3-demethylubiquinone-9 3-methyltransferase